MLLLYIGKLCHSRNRRQGNCFPYLFERVKFPFEYWYVLDIICSSLTSFVTVQRMSYYIGRSFLYLGYISNINSLIKSFLDIFGNQRKTASSHS